MSWSGVETSVSGWVKPLIGIAGLPEAQGGQERPLARTLATFVCTILQPRLRKRICARQGDPLHRFEEA